MNTADQPIKCSDCGEIIDVDDGYSISYSLDDDRELCTECWYKDSFQCCLCCADEGIGHMDDIGDLLVVADSAALLTCDGELPGLYRIIEHPYFTAAHGGLGASWVFTTAVERIGDVPADCDTEGYAVGHVCRSCKGKLLAALEAGP